MPEWSGFIRESLTAAGRTLDDDVVEELSQHAAATYEAARAEGCSNEEARREVEALVTSWCVDAAALRRRPRRPPTVEAPPSSSPFLAGILHDVRYGARLLKREPGYTLVAIVTMALGIGVATTLFSSGVRGVSEAFALAGCGSPRTSDGNATGTLRAHPRDHQQRHVPCLERRARDDRSDRRLAARFAQDAHRGGGA